MGQSQLSSSLKKIYSAVRWLVLEISKRHSRELKTCFREDAVEGFKGGTNGRRWRYSLRPKVRGKHESTEEIDALLWQKERWRESNREREFQHELSTYCLTDPPRLWLLLSSPVCALVEPPASAERRSGGRRRIKDLPIITVLFSPCFCCCCLLLFLPPPRLFKWRLPPINLEDAPNGPLQRRFRRGSLVCWSQGVRVMQWDRRDEG